MNAWLAWDNAALDALSFPSDGYGVYTATLNNMGKQSLSLRWQSASLSASGTRFTFSCTAAGGVDPALRMLVLASHNMSLAATVRVRASLNAGFTQQLYDSGTLPVFPLGVTEANRRGMRWNAVVPLGVGNLLGNTDWINGAAAPWGIGYNSTGGTDYSAAVDLGGPSTVPTGDHIVGVRRFGASRTGLLDLGHTYVEVDAGQTYQLSAYLSSTRGDCDILVAWWTSQAGGYVYLGETHFAPPTRAAGGTSLSSWALVGGVVQAPAGAVAATIAMRTYATDAAQTDSFYYLCRPTFCRATPGQVGLQAWAPRLAAPYWRVDISDASNPAGVVTVGRLAAFQQLWQPSVNMLQGAAVGWESNNEIQRAIGGPEWFTESEPRRVARFSLHVLPQAEVLSNGFDLMRQAAGARREVLFQYDPADTQHFVRRTLFGRLRQLSVLEEAQAGYLGSGWEVAELL